jgi:hypothetical protein
MDDDWLVMGGLTVAMVIGLGILITGVLQDAEHLNTLQALGSATVVLTVMGMAGYLNRI